MKDLNRLWVRISAVLLGVVLITAVFPIAYRFVTGPGWLNRPSPERPNIDMRNAEEFQPEEFRQRLERRFWRDVSVTLAVGGLVGLAAGLVLTRWLMAPLQRLEDGARSVANQQLETRIAVQGSTEMRAVAEAFNQMAVNLERQEKLRRDLLADVTHELRHPIHILQGNLQAILDGVYPLDMEEIARLSDQTQGLTYLVNDLHELALAEAKQLPLNKRKTDLNELVDGAVDSFQPLFEERSISPIVNLPDESIISEIDADRIRQALQNLIGNAIRYTSDGGQIEVSLQDTGDLLSICVHDSGIGIKEEDLPHVFDRFYRADTARDRSASGAGLGLAIAQAIIQAHGGWIEADSAGLNKGSQFTIKLPKS